MAITPYDKASWSTYTPLTSEQIMAPAMMMRERHDKLDEEYAAINDELQAVAFIAENDPDPEIKNKYSNFMDNLEQGRDQLMESGITSSSRRNMLDLRSKFQSEIQPLKLGYEMKAQDINNYNQMKAKDNTFIGIDPSQKSVSDYINNGLQPFAQNGISGALVTKMAAEYLTPFSQERNLSDTELIGLLHTAVGEERMPQYYDYIKNHGYKPGTSGFEELMKGVKSNIIGATGIDSWADEKQLGQVDHYINMASSSLLGKEQSQILDNKNFGLSVKRAEDAAQNPDPDFMPIRLPGEITLAEVDKTNFEEFKKGEKNNSNIYNKALALSDSYEEFTELASPKKGDADYDKNIEGWKNVYEDKKNITDFNSREFNPVKAAFKFKEEFSEMSEIDKENALKELLPDINASDLTMYLAQGAAGFAMAAKLAEASGASFATITGLGSKFLKTSLPLLAGEVFTSSGSIGRNNSESFQNALNEMNNPLHSQYLALKEAVAKSGNNYSDEQIMTILENDLRNRSVVTQEVFSYEDNVLNSYQEKEARAHMKDLRKSGGYVTMVDKEGKSKTIKASEITDKFGDKVSDILNNEKALSLKGHIPVDKKLNNRPSYQFTKTIDGNDYYVNVPANSLDKDYQASRAVYEAIDRGISSPTRVNTSYGELVVIPEISGMSIKYWVITRGADGKLKRVTPESIMESDGSQVSRRYHSKSKTRSEVNQGGQ